MKLRRRRAAEVPSKIKSFISSVTAVPLEQIHEPLANFRWEFEKGDFHHWVDLFNHFDTFFEKHVKVRKDLHIEENLEESDPPFPKDAVLQVLRVIRIVLENCTNKHFYSSYEQHLSLLLASTDADVVEACLQTLAAFLKRQIGKYSIRDASLNSKLFSLAQGWGGKEEGLGLTSCATENNCDQVSHQLGCTLHFEFYASSDSSSELSGGLQIIHVPDVSKHSESDLELLKKLVNDHNVPPSLRFSLLTRLRFARAFSSLATRQQYTCIRLYAFIVLVQASGDTENIVSFFHGEPEFVNELVGLVSCEETVPEKIRILCLLSLVALSQDRTRQTTVLTAVTSGGNRGLLSGLMQKAIDSVISNTSKWSLAFAEALLSLVTVLVSSSSGCSAMREAGLIPTLVPLIKDTDPQHLHLVGTAVHILEAFMDYSNPAAALFRDLGALDDTIFRLKLEVSHTEDNVKGKNCSSDSNGSDSLVVGGSINRPDTEELPYSEALISYHRRLLLKALLRAISLGTYAPGNTNLYGSEESLLPECLCIIFQRAKDFGGGVFSLAATVMSDLIHKDPTCFNALDSAGLTSAFLDAISDDVICSAEAITCIPQCLDALCLNNSGLQAVKDRNALRCFVKIFTSPTYLRALTGDTPGSLSSGLDELLRHQSSLRTHGVDMFIEILNSMLSIGSGTEPTTTPVSTEVPTDAAPVPMEIDADEKSLAVSDEAESSSDTSPANIELFLPDCVCNVARLFETVLQNAEVCSLFVEKKGIDAVLQLFSLPLMPLSTSLGQSFSVAFKNFSPQHSAGLARVVCSYLREHLKKTNDLLRSIKGTQLLKLEPAVQMNILRSLSCLEGILSLSNFLLKGTASVISELSTADADVLKELGLTYKETIWQMALCSDTKEDEKKSVDQGPDNSVPPSSSTVERESDEDTSIAPAVRYTNPVSIRSSSSQTIWGGDREFLSVVRSGDARTRHAIARRTRRHLESLNFDSEISHDLPEMSSSHEPKKKSTEVLISEILNKLNCTLRFFFTALVKGFSAANRRRIDGVPLSSASKTLGTALAKVFLEALNFQGYGATAGHDDISLSVKCRYLGKVVDDITSLTFDTRRRVCFTAMVNSFYVHGTFKELLTTFEATSQLLWTVPFSIPASGTENEKPGERNIWSHSTWLVDTLQNYCRALDYFVNSTFLLSPASSSQTQLLVQPASVGLSIGLFPVPREPETFVRSLQSQVLDVILPIWNHPMFPECNPNFVASVTSLVTHIYSGVVDARQNRSGVSRGTNQRALPLQPDEATVGMIVEMGFSRSRAEDALRRVGTNSVEMAMEWLFTHPEDHVQEDDELAQALALSLGNSSETPKPDDAEKPVDVPQEEAEPKEPPVDEVIAASVKLFQSDDSMAFPLMDLFVTLCSRNKGEDRPKIVSYLIQQLKLVQLDFSKDTGALTMIPHILALVLSEDDNTREIAAQDGIVAVAIDILMGFKLKSEPENEILAPKCVSALLLILSMMLQAKTRTSSERVEGNQGGSLEPSDSPQDSALALKKALSSDVAKGESNQALELIFGKSTGYLTMEEGEKALLIACGLIKQRVPAMIMQAVLQLCARLTKTHDLAIQFLENGGLSSLFNLPKKCFFPGYDTVASVIVRHLVEDPQTLQIAMESEIRQTLSGKRQIGRVLPQTFLTTMAPVISRDPVVFMKAVTSTCQLESSGGREFVILSKEKEKPKVSGSEHGGLSLNEPIGISENKLHDGSGKCSKSHRRVSANFIQVIDQLIDIVLRFPGVKRQEDDETNLISMEVDEPTIKVKGKSKVGEPEKTEPGSEKSEELARVTFILKLLSDIILMYLHGTSVLLRRDTEISQLRGSNLPDDSPGNGGLIYHVIHRLLPISFEKFAGPDEWKEKLSEKASWFLVVLCSRSSEGRKRIISELSRILSVFASLGRSSSKSVLLPDKRVLAFADLVYSILTKNSSSSNLPGCGCSPEVAKSMIDGGTIQCLTSILHVIDLDHPDAPKLVTLILKSLETLTRAANAAEQLKSLGPNEKKSTDSNERHDGHGTSTEAEGDVLNQNNSSRQQVTGAMENGQDQPQASSQSEGERSSSQTQSMPQEMRIEGDETILPEPIQMDFMREDIEGDQIEMSFHVENRADDDGDDDMGDEGEDDEGEDEDADLVEDGAGVMSLAETDVEDPEDTGLGDEYNDDMIDEDEDDFHENRVIEVRWREALDGLDHFQILGRSGGGNGFIEDITAEPFEGVNVDDLFALRRPLGFERRRQTGRSSLDRSGSEVHGFQHPLFSRPLQTSNTASGSASVASISRHSEAGSYDVAQFYMFDTPVLPFDQVPGNPFSDRLGGGVVPPPLTDYSVVGMNSSRRGVGDSRWTDIGHPQPSNQSASIAQLIEEHFISNLRASAPADAVVERETNGTEVQEQQQPDVHPSDGSETVLRDGNDGGQQTEERELLNNTENVNNPTDVTAGNFSQGQANLASPVVREAGECTQQHENDTPNEIDGMDVGEGDGVPVEQATSQGQPDTSSTQNVSVSNTAPPVDDPDSNLQPSVDVDMSGDGAEENQSVQPSSLAHDNNELSSMEATQDAGNDEQVAEGSLEGGAPEANAIDPTFLEALPEDLRAEVLASQQAQSVQPPTYEPPAVDDIDPEFLAALPPEIQTEVLAQQRAQRMVQQSQGQPVDMDNASIIATLPADLREEVLLTSSEAVLAALPSPLLAEAQMLRDRAMSHYQARSLFGSTHRLNNRRNGLGYNRLTGLDRGVGVSIGQRAVSSSADGLKVKEMEGDPLVNADSLKSLIRLLRLAQPLGKGLLQRLLLNLCAHSVTRANLVQLLLDMIRPEMEKSQSELAIANPQRLYGCQSNVVYGRSQLLNGLPPLVFRRVLEILTYLATNHSAVADMLFYFDVSLLSQLSSPKPSAYEGKGKEKVTNVPDSRDLEIPLLVFLKLLNRPQLLQSTSHLSLVMGLLQVVVYTAASRIEGWSPSSVVPEKSENKPVSVEASSETQKDAEPTQENVVDEAESARRKNCADIYNIFLQLPQSDLCNLCILLGYEGLSDKIYSLAGDVLKKLAAVDLGHRKFFTKELSELASGLSASTVRELATLSKSQKMSRSTGSMAGASILRVLQVLSSLTSPVDNSNEGTKKETEQEEQNIMQRLNVALEPLWQELSQCISITELQLDHTTATTTVSNVNPGEHVLGISPSSPLAPGTQRLLPLIEAFFVLCEKIQTSSVLQQDHANVTAGEVKESALSSSSKTSLDSQKKTDGSVTFTKFAEKHRRLLNSFVRQNPSLLEKSLSMMLKAPRLIDFDNKKAYFRSRIRHQHDQHISGPLRISVRRAYVLEDSYNQLRMRSPQDLKGRLNVQFQGEEGIDAGGLTREWYQLLSRVIFDKGALLFTTVGNDATFQPNPNSVYQTEHLSYFKFVGRMVAKALFDGQLLDVYFTRSFYKHILGVKVTYHDIEAVDPDYYKNLKWLLENDVSDILDLTFSMDADEEKHILYEKTEVTDYELKPGGRNTRVTEETKHEYVDLVAGHILTNAIRPQINAFLEGFNELIPRELVSIFNDKELELLISGLPEIDFEDLKANTEYTSYTAGSPVIHWFWEVVKAFSKEDMARFLQFVTGTSKVPLEGFKALQGISGPQRLQIHKAYGAPERLPSAHTCFNQLDLPEYQSKEQLQERLLLAIHEASEGFGFA